MNPTQSAISNLSNDQIKDLKALEAKFNTANAKNQQIILIAYTNP